MIVDGDRAAVAIGLYRMARHMNFADQPRVEGVKPGFGVAIQRALASEGFDTLTIPWGQLGLFLVLAAVVGVLAALWPGRRAAKVDILRAITTE